MKIKELYRDESKWTKGAFARDHNGNRILCGSKEAASRCLSEAINFCYEDTKEYKAVLAKVIDKIAPVQIWWWNDHHTFEEVKDLVELLNI